MNADLKVEVLHVPYRGMGPALTAAVGGEVQVQQDQYASAQSLIKAGKLRPIAVAAPTRLMGLPQLPTLAELGYPQLNALGQTWFCLLYTSDPNLIARKLAVCRSIVCASPDYLQREGEPARVEDLSLRNCLTHSYFGKSLWRFEREGVPVDVPVSGNISANEVSVLLQAALEGAGVAMLPTYYAAEYVAQGRLKVILPQAKPQELGIYGVYASRRQMPLILRSMLDFLVERLGPAPWDQS